MDKNSITGIVLICAIMFGWMWYSAPSKEELAKQKREKDSLELAVAKNQAALQQEKKETKQLLAGNNTINDTLQPVNDSLKRVALQNKFDVFAQVASGKDSMIVLENNKIKACIATKGGRISSVILKEYVRHDSTALELFDKENSSFSILFDTENNRMINTGDLFFQANTPTANTVSMRLYANGNTSKYMEFLYSLEPDSYLLNVTLHVVGMQEVVASNLNELLLNWKMIAPSQEKHLETQQQASTAYFKYADAEPDYINETKDETIPLNAKTKWVAFKQQFFTSVIIADEVFDKTGADVSSAKEVGNPGYTKSFGTTLSIPYAHKNTEEFGMKFYFGPNHFQTLKKYDLNLEKQIPLGWGIFGWVNKFLVIPVFSFLSGFNLNYALIILCLTLVFKTLLFPIAYKTYTSSAKMRVLKPEVDEINEKYGNEDPLKKQQAMMALYKKAGVNPLAGCIPALLQLPILMALFRFFPASIELRQQGFWWVSDLSTYDSVWNFGKLPVIDFIYGDHVSVWAILCTITTLIYTQMNSQLMGNPGAQQQMPGMKYMMYLMPIMFLPFLNKFSAGLSYYYTLANLISFGQMFVIRSFVDEKKLRLQIEENKKKPAKAPSSFQQKLQKRLQEAQKQRGNIQKKVK
jgi:YidC/Oxa1 family membrane protein insertase